RARRGLALRRPPAKNRRARRHISRRGRGAEGPRRLEEDLGALSFARLALNVEPPTSHVASCALKRQRARAANARRTLFADASPAFRCNFDKKIFPTLRAIATP